MPTIVSALSLKSNPFEHYTAETEPNIADYAVKPPYLSTISQRAATTTSFILFGDRGAGKSATRITLFQELWGKKAGQKSGESVPLAVNYIDFTTAVAKFKKGTFGESDFIHEASYLVVETILSWLSSLTDEEREIYTEGLDKDERSLVIALLKSFYLSRSDLERRVSERNALTLLNQAWTTKSAFWIGKRWDKVAAIGGMIVDLFTKKYVTDSADVSDKVEKLINSFSGGAGNYSGRLVLEKLVDFVKMFGFSGIVILIDKVDETEVTNNSAEATTKLMHPLLSHIQLLEVDGFAWHMFLWSQVKPYLESDQYRVRLDKIAYSTITWDSAFFMRMLDERILFFSEGRLKFSDLFTNDSNVPQIVNDLIGTSMRSPRELIRLMDTIITEHDIAHADSGETVLINNQSVEDGQDKYVKDRIDSVYNEKTLGQIYRLQSLKFTNKDVQTRFRVNPQSARNKIKLWEDAGIVKHTGTRAAEGEQGGKPSYEYSVVDARVERVIRKGLVAYDELPEGEEDIDLLSTE